jgi:hypothetical protein
MPSPIGYIPRFEVVAAVASVLEPPGFGELTAENQPIPGETCVKVAPPERKSGKSYPLEILPFAF